jgi:hypothetical protein
MEEIPMRLMEQLEIGETDVDYIGPIGAFVLDPRMRSILAKTREVPNGPLPNVLIRRTHDPILITSVFTLMTLLLGIVFLMATKPLLLPAILVILLASVLGLFLSFPFWSATWRRAGQKGTSMKSREADPFFKQTIWTRRW